MSKIQPNEQYKDLYDKITFNAQKRNSERARKALIKLLIWALIFVAILILSKVVPKDIASDYLLIFMLVFFAAFIGVSVVLAQFALVDSFDRRRKIPTRSFNMLCEEGLGDKMAEQYDSSIVLPIKYKGTDSRPTKEEKKQGIVLNDKDYYWRFSEDFIYVSGYGVFSYDIIKWLYQKNVTTRYNVTEFHESFIEMIPHKNKIGLSKLELSFKGGKEDLLQFAALAKKKNPDLILGYSDDAKKDAKKTK